MSRVRYKQFEQLSFSDIEVFSCLPKHPIWSPVAELVDFSFADEVCSHLYSGRGQYPYAPSLKLKLHVVQRYYALSDREMEERIIGDLFIKRFLGLPVSFIGFDHSTLGLDRDRIGSELFNACHHHILAQAKQKGLWGDNKDFWLVDSFPTFSHMVKHSSYRLIQQGMFRTINPLKRAFPVLYEKLLREVDVSTLTVKFPREATVEEQQVVFSKLVTAAYGLLHWFESEAVRTLFWSWTHSHRQLISLESQAWLYEILTQNVHPEDPNSPDAPYKKRAKKDKPKNLIRSAVCPDVRNGHKSKTVKFTGDKIQVVQSALSGFVLTAEPIPGNEDDGKRMLELVKEVNHYHSLWPAAFVGDTAYGTGQNLQAVADMELMLSAPVWSQFGIQKKGMYSHEAFLYDTESNSLTCPNGEVSTKSRHDNTNEATIFTFAKKVCMTCELRSSCTSAETTGRQVFRSDYHEHHMASRARNETEEGKAMQAARQAIERKNNEMKNHHDLAHTHKRTREKRRVDVKVSSIVVNLKVMVKQVGSLTLGFKRKKESPLPRGKSVHLAV